MIPEEELIMIHETLWFIATWASPALRACITNNRGLNSWGKISFGGCGLRLVWMLTPHIGIILHQN